MYSGESAQSVERFLLGEAKQDVVNEDFYTAKAFPAGDSEIRIRHVRASQPERYSRVNIFQKNWRTNSLALRQQLACITAADP
jgi:hypothetical protein